MLRSIISQLKKHAEVRNKGRTSNNEDTLSTMSGMTNVSLNGRAAYHEVHKYIKLIKKMAELNYDIRRLNYLRISLLRENNTETDFIPYPQFVTQSTRILNNIRDFQESDVLATMKDLLTEPKIAGDPNPREEDLMFSLPRFGLLVELFHYFPVMYKKDANLST